MSTNKAVPTQGPNETTACGFAVSNSSRPGTRRRTHPVDDKQPLRPVDMTNLCGFKPVGYGK